MTFFRALLGGAAAAGGGGGTDTADLITALGGNSAVRAFYDYRYEIASVSGLVSQWDDVRGAGYGVPALAQATSGNRPTLASDGVTVSSGAHWLRTTSSPVFALGDPMTLVVVGALNSQGYLASIDTGGGTLPGTAVALVSESVFETKLAGVTRASGAGGGYSCGVERGTAVRVLAMARGSTRAADRFFTPDQDPSNILIPGAGTGWTSFGGTSEALSVLSAGDGYFGPTDARACAVLVLDGVATTTQIEDITDWAETYHGAARFTRRPYWPTNPMWLGTRLGAMGAQPTSTIDASDPNGPFWYGFGFATGRAELFEVEIATTGSFTVTTTDAAPADTVYPYIRLYDAAGTLLATHGGSHPTFTATLATATAGNRYFVEVFQGNAAQTTPYDMTLSGTATLVP